MRSMSARTLIASLLLIGVLLPSRATGQEGPEVEVRRLSNVWLCPMPVVGMGPGAVERHVDEFRLKLQDVDADAEPTASGPCFNPLVMQLAPPDATPIRLLRPFREPTPQRDPFGLRDSLMLEFPLPSDSLPFHLLPPTLDP